MPTTSPLPASKPKTGVAGTFGKVKATKTGVAGTFRKVKATRTGVAGTSKKVKATKTGVAGTFTFPKRTIIREYYGVSSGYTLTEIGQGLTGPICYKHTDPVLGELYQPAAVVPPVAVNLPAARAYVFAGRKPAPKLSYGR